MSTIMTAAAEYAKRPADESFDSIGELVTAARKDKELSAERAYNLKDLLALIVSGDNLRAAPTSAIVT
jgi:hypothetical protein